jgi:hypothetical protein
MVADVAKQPGLLEELFSAESTHYHRLPVRRQRSDYDAVLDRYVERARRAPGVVGVARFGNVSAPGISDLDLVVLTEPVLPPGAGSLLSVEGLPEVDREVMLHDPMVVPEDGIGHVFDHLDLPQLTPVWGRIPASPLPAESTERWRKLSVLLEWLPSYHSYFANLALQRRIDVRWLLPVLHSIRYTTTLAADLLDVRCPWGSFLDEVEQLRLEWFDLPSDAERARRAAAATAWGWDVIGQACFEVEKALLREKALPSLEVLPRWSVLAEDRYTLLAYAQVASAEQFIHGTLALNQTAGVLRLLPARWRKRFTPYRWVMMPPFHLAHTLAATASAGVVQRRFMERCVRGPQARLPHPRGEFETYLVALGRRLEEQARFLQRNGLAFGTACSRFLLDLNNCQTCPCTLPGRVRRSVDIGSKIPVIRRALAKA